MLYCILKKTKKKSTPNSLSPFQLDLFFSEASSMKMETWSSTPIYSNWSSWFGQGCSKRCNTSPSSWANRSSKPKWAPTKTCPEDSRTLLRLDLPKHFFNQSINYSINQSINQSIHQRTLLLNTFIPSSLIQDFTCGTTWVTDTAYAFTSELRDTLHLPGFGPDGKPRCYPAGETWELYAQSAKTTIGFNLRSNNLKFDS